jgi:hypothetical protein
MNEIREKEIEPMSQLWFSLTAQHIATGGTCAVGVLSVAYLTEREFQRSIQSLWRDKQD